ncbi:MAG: SPOR domain-containing protein [Bacteroidota bacterium]|nr:SPOR domain-containing protein [Bacteroidota bacterium]
MKTENNVLIVEAIRKTNFRIPAIFLTFFALFFLISNQSFAQSDTSNIFNSLENKIDGEGVIIINQDKRIVALVKKQLSQNKSKMSIPGYRIQIYSGSGKRSEAKRIRAKFMKQFPNLSAELKYEEPSFKVRVGRFRTKQEGYKIYKKICTYFPNAYFVIENEMEWPMIDD